ncbi:MAG: chorismate-binding protein [Candidatus Tectimicrobiota bacterium]
MARLTSTHVTPMDILAYLLTVTPQEDTLSYGDGRGQVRRLMFPLDYAQEGLAPLSLYRCLNARRPGVLYESVDIAPIYGRFSLAVIDPPVIVEGKDERFCLRALNARGQAILAHTITAADLPCCPQIRRTAQELTGTVPCERRPAAEDERLHLNNISQVIRNLLSAFQCEDRFLGLYGAFAYDFVRLFEPLPDTLPAIATQDFRLFMPDTLLSYDHMRERAVLYVYDFLNSHTPPGDLLRERLTEVSPGLPEPLPQHRLRIPHKMESDMGRAAFMAAVDDAREQMRLGEFFEVVLSHSYKGRYDRSPLELYQRFREINPSPYQFYVDYGDEALVGASPEMFVRVEKGLVQQRPISGTMPRGTDSLTDYHNMMRLLNSEKEKSELDMLIDLARNDVSRVCEPGVSVSDYRYVEKYSRVMHTVAQVEGRLAPGWSAFDAFVASLNAGTLTGAPKAAAMTYIALHENSRRGYYGGNVGYLTFSGQLDTGIIIRTAHLTRRTQDAEESYDVAVRAGATLLYDSEPAAEYAETEAKARALLEALDSVE